MEIGRGTFYNSQWTSQVCELQTDQTDKVSLIHQYFVFNYSIINKRCMACPFDCYTCDSAGNCLTCNSTADYRVLNGTRCIHMGGYYELNVTTAAACSNGCLVCLNNTYCKSCLAGYYANTDSNTCVQCPSICTTCLSPTYCSGCSSSAFLRSDHFCYSTCLARTYA